MENFEEIVEQYTPMIYHMMRSLHIYKNQEEFFQIGLIALWEARQRFNSDKGTFSTYAYSYIKGRMLTELSSQNKVEERNVYPDEVFWETAVDTMGQPPLQLEQLLSYCDGLTDKQKQWVTYTFYFGLSVVEIAEIENVSPSAVKKWRSGALAKLRMNLDMVGEG